MPLVGGSGELVQGSELSRSHLCPYTPTPAKLSELRFLISLVEIVMLTLPPHEVIVRFQKGNRYTWALKVVK